MTQPRNTTGLAKGNPVRFARAALKREIKAGGVQVSEVLEAETPDFLVNMPILQLFECVPRLSRKVIYRWLEEAGSKARAPLSANQPIGRVTKRQRLLLAGLSSDWEARRDRKKVAA